MEGTTRTVPNIQVAIYFKKGGEEEAYTAHHMVTCNSCKMAAGASRLVAYACTENGKGIKKMRYLFLYKPASR